MSDLEAEARDEAEKHVTSASKPFTDEELEAVAEAWACKPEGPGVAAQARMRVALDAITKKREES